ncbi:MAG: sel1 repeat family protein [Betaproteobacteria bacterium]|nr:MAG: sel1 repeat family protein [Betaproteobacteria bacterium]
MKQAILFLISLVVLSSPSYAQEFDDADSDFERKHESAAIALDRELAEFGDLTAQFNLAVAYEFGTGIEQDYGEAVYWYTKSAEQGLAEAQSNLAVMHYEGRGTPQDYQLAAYWFERAAKQGDAKSQNNLGAMYYQGSGVERDYLQAHFWWGLAAAQGNENAYRNLDMVEKLMTLEQIAEAQRLAFEWLRNR